MYSTDVADETNQSLFLTPLAKRGPHKPVGEMGCLKRSLFYMADETYRSFVITPCSIVKDETHKSLLHCQIIQAPATMAPREASLLRACLARTVGVPTPFCHPIRTTQNKNNTQFPT